LRVKLQDLRRGAIAGLLHDLGGVVTAESVLGGAALGVKTQCFSQVLADTLAPLVTDPEPGALLGVEVAGLAEIATASL
jgi:hypothetical protein